MKNEKDREGLRDSKKDKDRGRNREGQREEVGE